MLQKICNTSPYLQMSVKITQWGFKRNDTEPLQADVSGHYPRQRHTPHRFLQNHTLYVCVSHPLSSRGQQIPPSKWSFSSPHTLCTSFCSPHTWRAPQGKRRRLRRLRSPSCVASTLPTVHKQAASYPSIICKERSLCEAIRALTEVRLRAPRRPRASEKKLLLIVRNGVKWNFTFAETLSFLCGHV